MIKVDGKDLMVVSHENCDTEEYVEEFMDDTSGQILYTKPVRETRVDEMDQLAEHNVYTKRPISECVRITEKQHIGSK